jgi:hypothetical protein
MDKYVLKEERAYKKLAIECDSDDVPLGAFQYGFYSLRKTFYFLDIRELSSSIQCSYLGEIGKNRSMIQWILISLRDE